MDSVGCYFIDQLQLSLWVRTKDGCRFLLKDRERDTFIKLYALWDDEREWQHQEVADTLHLTRKRIRQMEMKAFKKLAYRKKQSDTPPGRLYTLLTSNNPQATADKTSLACHLHNFHEAHLPEWSKARFFRFTEYFLGVNKLENALKKAQRSPRPVREPEDKLKALYDKIIWPPEIMYRPVSDQPTFSPQRGLLPERESDLSITGEYFSPKLQRQVFYESALERSFFKALERPEVHSYCEQPFTLSIDIGGKKHFYTPDVWIHLKDGRCIVVEIKPLDLMVDTEVQWKFQCLYEYCRERGWGVLLTNGRHDLSYLSTYPPNIAFEQALLQELSEKRRLTIGRIHALKKEYGANSLHLAGCILRHNLSYRAFPTLLWRTKKGGICQVLREKIERGL